MSLVDLRTNFLRAVGGSTARLNPVGRAPNIADKDNPRSVRIAQSIFRQLGIDLIEEKLNSNTLGKNFEVEVAGFCAQALELFDSALVGRYEVLRKGDDMGIGAYSQYSHLPSLKQLADTDERLRLYTSIEYAVRPDICIARRPLSPHEWAENALVQESLSAARYSPALYRGEKEELILDSVVSCKWTIRSDRAQNVRTEALNLMRNRKGPLPSILVVTFEPLPSRLVAVARGTGDVDCTYHAALPELMTAVREEGTDSDRATIDELVDGGRLRDIADMAIDIVY